MKNSWDLLAFWNDFGDNVLSALFGFLVIFRERVMTGAEIYRDADFAQYVSVESEIAESLSETADELAHTECFDQEQRAEIYAILQAIKTDTENHHRTVQLLAKKMNGEIPDA